jgi:hypothetical protein
MHNVHILFDYNDFWVGVCGWYIQCTEPKAREAPFNQVDGIQLLFSQFPSRRTQAENRCGGNTVTATALLETGICLLCSIFFVFLLLDAWSRGVNVDLMSNEEDGLHNGKPVWFINYSATVTPIDAEVNGTQPKQWKCHGNMWGKDAVGERSRVSSLPPSKICLHLGNCLHVYFTLC